jgi:homoserine O-acetyltransferase/O-succinyltransferase
VRAPDPVTFEVPMPALTAECGVRLPQGVLRGWWWGPAREADRFVRRAVPAPPVGQVARRDGDARVAAWTAASAHERPKDDLSAPVVLGVHALTADAAIGGPHGWWQPVVGPGRALDPDRVHVLCFNNLGSCYGSLGPGDEGYPNLGRPAASEAKGAFALPADHPAPVGTWDQARALLAGLDALGIHDVRLATGGSLGGMVVFALGMLTPRIRAVAPIASSTRSTPWIQGFNHIGRMAILQDPGWPEAVGPGLELARQLAHLSYRAEPGLLERHGFDAPPGTQLPIQTYLQHQGRKLRARFDARAYLTQIAAMDHHDVTRPPPPPESFETWTRSEPWSWDRWTAPCSAIGIDTDQLYRPEHLRQVVRDLDARGVSARYREIVSPHGHDAFLIEWDQLNGFLSEALGERGT